MTYKHLLKLLIGMLSNMTYKQMSFMITEILTRAVLSMSLLVKQEMMNLSDYTTGFSSIYRKNWAIWTTMVTSEGKQ